MKKYIIFLTLAVLACGSGKSEEIIEKSRKGGVITIRGDKPSVASPFIVKMKLDFQQWHDSLQFESYSSELTRETVHFNWITDGFCKLSFIQRDGDSLQFQIFMDPGRLVVERMKKRRY